MCDGPSHRDVLQDFNRVRTRTHERKAPGDHGIEWKRARADRIVSVPEGRDQLHRSLVHCIFGFEDKDGAADQIWDKIFEVGTPQGLKPIGLGARDTLRLEMGYCLYGNDIDDTTSPLEAGLGWITKFSKDFVSKPILEAQKEAGVERRLVGFEMIDKGIPRHGYEIKDFTGAGIGFVTSGTQSPSLGKAIGLGYVRTAFSKIDQQINIKIREKLLLAKVVKVPFI